MTTSFVYLGFLPVWFSNKEEFSNILALEVLSYSFYLSVEHQIHYVLVANVELKSLSTHNLSWIIISINNLSYMTCNFNGGAFIYSQLEWETHSLFSFSKLKKQIKEKENSTVWISPCITKISWWMMVGHESEEIHFTSAGHEPQRKRTEFMYNLTKFSLIIWSGRWMFHVTFYQRIRYKSCKRKGRDWRESCMYPHSS